MIKQSRNALVELRTHNAFALLFLPLDRLSHFFGILGGDGTAEPELRPLLDDGRLRENALVLLVRGAPLAHLPPIAAVAT
jgi:hypothetical protein